MGHLAIPRHQKLGDRIESYWIWADTNRHDLPIRLADYMVMLKKDDVPSGNQTWLAGKSPKNTEVLIGQSSSKWM